jgi:hypothetical protein
MRCCWVLVGDIRSTIIANISRIERDVYINGQTNVCYIEIDLEGKQASRLIVSK